MCEKNGIDVKLEQLRHASKAILAHAQQMFCRVLYLGARTIQPTCEVIKICAKESITCFHFQLRREKKVVEATSVLWT